jgi:putative tricarboxylic transport membrane protein
MMESNYRRSLVLSGGDHMTFLQDPISAGLLAASALFIVGSLLRQFFDLRKKEQGKAAA